MANDGDEFKPLREDSRLSHLEERLQKAERVEVERTGQVTTPESDTSYQAGNKVLSGLLGGILGGLAIGWTVDWLFGTTPWGLLGFLFLGIGVAFRNIIKLSTRR